MKKHSRRSDDRPQDVLYDQNMACEKSSDAKHHFIPVKESRTSQVIQCAHCAVHYDYTKHNPPEGYLPYYLR